MITLDSRYKSDFVPKEDYKCNQTFFFPEEMKVQFKTDENTATISFLKDRSESSFGPWGTISDIPDRNTRSTTLAYTTRVVYTFSTKRFAHSSIALTNNNLRNVEKETLTILPNMDVWTQTKKIRSP